MSSRLLYRRQNRQRSKRKKNRHLFTKPISYGMIRIINGPSIGRGALTASPRHTGLAPIDKIALLTRRASIGMNSQHLLGYKGI
jgi:hypothetical protein